MPDPSTDLDLARRRFLACFASTSLASTLFPGALWAALQEQRPPRITAGLVSEAERIAGVEFTDSERASIVDSLNEGLGRYEGMRAYVLKNSDWPAQQFDPALPGMSIDKKKAPPRRTRSLTVTRPPELENLAFWGLPQLAELLRTRKVSSLELTRMFLDRLKRYDPQLQCVVTLTEERALRLATAADQEIARGRYRGPLHGIPWGVKDLMATRDYKTTWGAAPFVNQQFDYDASVVERLDRAGAVLVAKLATGELATGDIWFGGQVKSPWNLREGTRGSSAGPASAVAAGLVPFAIGTETRGSITFPCVRCGLTGLRPSFGRVSRYGCMAISFSMDKIGPICHTAQDCALVFQALHGPDGKDPAVVDLPFNWSPDLDVRRLRVGYIKKAFDEEHETPSARENDLATIETLRGLGIELRPVDYPDYPVDVQSILLYAEAAAAFDEITRDRRVDMLARPASWPVRFRAARLIPAVEYIQADRVRLKVMQGMAAMMADLDVCVAPAGAPGASTRTAIGKNIPLTNLTGYPGVVMPNGFAASTGLPTGITLIGKLYGEDKILALAGKYQEATSFHLKKPELF